MVVKEDKLETIGLSVSQTDKLREMCDYLFEDYNFTNIYENGWGMSFYKLGNSASVAGMPWIEMCILHIPRKLEGISNLSAGYIMENWFYNPETHIIDYLFDIFKKHT